MARYILNSGAILTWIRWLERLVLIVACVFFAGKAYQNQPKLTSTLLMQSEDGTINITCDPESDAASYALRQATTDLARVLFSWDRGGIEGYKYQYQAFKQQIRDASPADQFVYNYVLKQIGTTSDQGPIERSKSHYTLNFTGNDWAYMKSDSQRRWAVSAVITQTVQGDTAPRAMKWEVYMEFVEGNKDAFYLLDLVRINQQ